MSSITIPILQLKNTDTPLVAETVISQTGFTTGVNTLPFQALYNLNQALQALEPAPNANTLELNDTILLNNGTTTNSINSSSITTSDDFTIQSSNQVFINSYDNTAFNTGVGFNLVAGDYIQMTANNDFINITADDDITLTSNSGKVNLLSTSAIILNSQYGVSKIGDADENNNKTYLIVNDAHKEIDLNCVDLLNGFQGSQYAVISPSFTNKQGGGINYGGGNGWTNVASNTINIPDFYFLQTNGLTDWKLEFSLNCIFMSFQTDKALGIYIEFVDSNSTSYECFNFNHSQPFTTHKNTSTYTQSSSSSENYCWTDLVNLNGVSGTPLTINLWWSADNAMNCNFSWVLSLSKTNLL